MSANRICAGLGTLILVMAAGLAASAQDHELRGMQLFESGDVRPYDDWAKPKEGFFFNFDGIFWYIGAPHTTTIGDPTLTPTVYYGPTDNQSFTETNSLNTGALRAKWREGNRIELGYIDGHDGFMVSTLSTNYQTEHIASGPNTYVVFNDPAFGNGHTYLQGFTQLGNTIFLNYRELPTFFTKLSAVNRAKFEGVETLYMYRTHQLFLGGSVEFLAGARYFEFDDAFNVDATGGILDAAEWYTSSKNVIVGPELGLRWSRIMGRFGLSTEGRFMAGVNSESIRQNGFLGTNLDTQSAVQNFTPNVPQFMNATYFNHSAHFTEFTPLVEFRVEGHAQITRLISLKVGWTGMFMSNIARSADLVNYTVPDMGIQTDLHGNRENLFIHGLNIGIELNR
jgi:hypothetical protein